MKVFFVDFNPNWGTRNQKEDRHLFGPYSTELLAHSVRASLVQQAGWAAETPQVEVISKDMDAPETHVFWGRHQVQTYP